MTQHYDVIIIGTGAGGGTMARALAPTGKRILILEKGGFVPREYANFDPHTNWVEKRYTPDDTWYHKGEPFRPSHPHYYVGGNTKFYGAALFRLRERDFEAVEHPDGMSPAWPISYADLEPYYAIGEQWYYVHGAAGADPTEADRSAPYPYAPLQHEPRIQKLNDDLAATGLHPFPIPMGLRLGRDNEPGATSSLDLWPQFDGYPDPYEIKADSHIVGVRPALEYENVTLKTHSPVERLEVDASGRKVDRVVVKSDAGEITTYSADLVVVAAGALSSALLFLRSAQDKHPNGLANSTDLVGRNFMGHNNATLMAISKTPNDATFEKTLALADYYWGDASYPYPMGLIQMLGNFNEALMQLEMEQPLPGMTHAEMAAHSLDFWLQSEDLPEPTNRIAYNTQGDVVFDYTANNVESANQLRQRLTDFLDCAGCHPGTHNVDFYLGGMVGIPLGHTMGTMKMGTDINTSVLDPYCRPHELDNVFVTDGSFFVSAGAVNPTLTIIAQTLRVADYIKTEWF
ncbi:GMC family oxidoreductase [filamentous cyanobacterium LEGE 11480]|uniref:GMC family oxidoreductase n=1 Tax=Romeriopsis navalis LEGE 11480 TaxID=2777977 RepID=A0A928VLS4_9CYAN|nr:GMC family oxidoreductase [Romeriopsis navalis]MBE9028717.1 GMC family oxidoreductase [Romeriopsis navalis LEGE 11480]